MNAVLPAYWFANVVRSLMLVVTMVGMIVRICESVREDEKISLKCILPDSTGSSLVVKRSSEELDDRGSMGNGHIDSSGIFGAMTNKH